MPLPRCYCDQSPKDAFTGQRRFMCNVCVNAIVEEKNRLVRAAHQLVSQNPQLQKFRVSDSCDSNEARRHGQM